MKRRDFLKSVGLSLAAVHMGASAIKAFQNDKPKVSITMDDFNVYDIDFLSGKERNRAILDALKNHSNLRAALFPAGKYLDNEVNMKLLGEWNEAGHIICNHTYSHQYYPKADFAEYTKDILHNEDLLKKFSQYRKMFRFPMLKEGKTLEQRDKMRSFLKEHGYKMGYVTIDASDWYIDGRLIKKVKDDPKADLSPYRDYYLKHILDRAQFYNNLSIKVFGRSIKHTLLIHHNVLNGLFLNDLLDMFKANEWELVDAEDAFTDPVFSQMPDILPAGESIVWASAKEKGKFEKELRYPAEDGIYEEDKMNALGL